MMRVNSSTLAAPGPACRAPNYPLIGDAAAASRLQNAAERTTAAHNAIWISAHPLSCPLGAAGAGVRSEVPDLDRARRACRGSRGDQVRDGTAHCGLCEKILFFTLP